MDLHAVPDGSDAQPRLSRRAMLGTVAAATPLLAGCSTVSDLLGGRPGDVTVFNKTDASVTATVRVTRNGETLVSDTVDIAASQSEKFEDLFSSTARYRCSVETGADVSNSHEWSLPSTDHYLFAIIHADSVEFRENGP